MTTSSFRAWTTRPERVVVVAFAAALVQTGAACTDLDIVPPDARLTCTSDDDCPSGFACRTAIGRCLENGLAQAAPIAVVTPTALNATRRSRRPGASTLIATATFSTTPTSVTGRLGDRELDCEGGAATVSCTIDLVNLADLEEGDVDVEIAADDGLGTIASSQARATIDLTPPDVVAGSAVVRYVRDVDNVLDAPGAIGPHSDATVQFSLTEAPGPAPTATLDDGTPLTFDAGLTTGRLAGLVIDGAALPARPAGADLAVDVAADVVVTLTDDVGNSRSVTLTDLLRIDQTPPATAAVTVADAVVYTRIPEGSRATAGVPRLSVVVSGGVEPRARVFVTTEEAFSSTRLGEAIADDAGSVTVDLAPVDLGRVFLHVVDEAGNVAPAARVRDIVWTASVAGRIPGNDRSNPHALFASSSFDGVSLRPHLRDELANGQELVIGDGITITARGAFVQDPLVGAGTPRTAGVSLVWHAARGELLAFGGATEDGTSQTSRLLRLEGERWVDVVIDGVLPPPAGGTAVYDPAGERLVLVQDSGDTWFLESALEGERWRQHVGDEPSAGSGASVAWDEGRRGVIRFGGRRSDGTTLDETWFFDGETWQALALSTSPPARHQAAMGYDRVDGCMLLRGGRGASTLLSDLWCLEPDGWRLIGEGQQAPIFGEENPTGSFPYSSGVAVTDPASGRVQFIGGTPGQQQLASGATFNGERLVGGPPVGGLVFMGAAWDLREQRLVSLRGSNFNLGNNLQTNFLVFEDGVTRRPAENRRGPSAAESALTTWDDANDRVVMLGGTITVPPNGIVLTSTRAWDGTTRIDLIGEGVTAAPFGGIAFDGAQIMGVGGSTFRLDAGAWVVDQPLPPGMPSSSLALTYHAGLDAAFSFGGSTGASDFTDVTATIRDGVVTTLTPTTRPPARRSAHVVYDVAKDRVVLYGGRDNVFLRDTWVFEDGDWRELATTTTDVLVARLVYDDVRGVVVRLGEGSGAVAMVVDELRDDVWVRRDVAIPGPARVDFNAAYDRARGETFVCGGFAAGTSRDEVFTWDGDVATRPAALFSVDLRAREAAAHTVRDITVVATAGGTGADLEGSGIDGVELLVWGDAWEPLTDSTAAADSPADVTAAIDDARLERVIRDRFVVAVAGPPSGAGPGARVRVETLEVTVRYREE